MRLSESSDIEPTNEFDGFDAFVSAVSKTVIDHMEKKYPGILVGESTTDQIVKDQFGKRDI